MRESDQRSHADYVRRADNSDHDRRNRSQDELFRAAMERRRHANYIDAMLRRAGDAEPEPNTDQPRIPAPRRARGE
jgi:hypothetical protein